MQVDPIEPKLKPPGRKRLKLIYGGPLSNFAFNLNLRCYTMVYTRQPDEADEYNFFSGARFVQLGRVVQIDPIKPTLNAPVTERLKLKCDEPPSNFALQIQLAPLHLGASDGVADSLKEMGIQRPSHIQALSYRALAGESGGGDTMTAAAAAWAAERGETVTVNVDGANESAEAADPDDGSGAATATRHLLLADQAGSGKTLAYLLPLMQRLSRVEAGAAGRAKPNRQGFTLVHIRA